MRSLIASALVLAACSGGDRSNTPATRTAASTPTARGPDALVLRVPRSGGVARVTAYPNIDSVVWTGVDAAPSLDRVLAFDANDGLIAAVDARGFPVWLDLRVGTVTKPSAKVPRGLMSVDGTSIYGYSTDGGIARFAPSGNWPHKPPLPARAVFPQSSGTILVLGGRGADARAWRMHPPEVRVLDSVMLPDVQRGFGAPLGVRVYFLQGNRTLIGVHSRTLAKGSPIEFDHNIVTAVATPSGDRLYVVTDSSRTLEIVAGFQDRVSGRIDLPGRARDVRVDPFGRYVLVRAATGDEVYVVAVGSDKVLGSVHSEWRGDVPFVAPDGAVAVTSGEDVVFVDPSSLKEIRRAFLGAEDFWYPFVWIGFRPRAAALDSQPNFARDTDTVIIADSLVKPETAITPKPVVADSVKVGFTVSFASLLDNTKAQAEAAKITVDGKPARVVTSVTDGTAVYHVILGPYATRDEAERVGRASGHSYYVYAGSP